MRFVRLKSMLLAMAALAWAGAGLRAAEPGPEATIQAFHEALLAAMKEGPALGFEGRRQLLEPAIRATLDLPLMTRLVMGPPWRSLSAQEQQQLVAAFSAYSIATYANRFSGFSGEVFTVLPGSSPQASGDVIVHTLLKTGDPEPVRLDYLMREKAGRWRVIDVYLSGTISELAARRSEYAAVLRKGGAGALAGLLNSKAADLAK